MSLFHPGPSKIQVMAKTDVEVWMINGKDFEAENYKTESGQVEKTISLLKEVPLLSNLTEEQLSSLVQMLQVVEYKDGEYIIKKGEQGTKFYIIKSGVAICYGGEEDIIGQKEGGTGTGGATANTNNNNNANNNSAAQQAMEHIQQAVYIYFFFFFYFFILSLFISIYYDFPLFIMILLFFFNSSKLLQEEQKFVDFMIMITLEKSLYFMIYHVQ